MLPGKKYTPEDFVRIVWRRKWLILLPTLAVALATFMVSLQLPNRFRSSARIQVVPQQVPEKFVQPTITSALDDRLSAISQEILSRPRLERIIENLNLYSDERRTMVMEDVIERMRRDVNITIDRPRNNRRADPGYFVVSYESQDPRTALHVTEQLTSTMISENLENREALAEQTSQFLQTQLEEARTRLVEHEQKLAQFRQAHMGELPTQVQSNLQVMQSTQMQLQALSDAGNRDRDRQLALDQMIADLEAIPPAPPEPAKSAGPNRVQKGTVLDQLNAERAQLQSLELHLTPAHPDVVRVKRRIAELEKQAELESVSTSAPDAPNVPTAQRVDVARLERLSSMRAERDTLDRKLAEGRNQQTRLERVIAGYRARVEASPARESELTELSRDYETLRASYNSLLEKSQTSEIAANLERQQIGQRFRVIEPASLPEKPLSPNRLRINGLGALAGLVLSLAFVAFLEYRDTTLKTDGDVAVSMALPVLGVIPQMITAGERHQTDRRRRLTALGATAVVALAGAGAVVAWKLQLLESWVR